MIRKSRAQSSSPVTDKEYWARIGRWSIPATFIGGLMMLPYCIRICTIMFDALFALEGKPALPESSWLDHTVWMILCAIGLILVTGGVKLASYSRRMYQQIELELDMSAATNTESHNNE